MDCVAALDAEEGGGGGGVDGELQESGAAPDGEGGVRRRFAVEVAEVANCFAIDDEGCVGFHEIARDVRDAVAEVIDVDDARAQVAILQHLWFEWNLKSDSISDPWSKLSWLDTVRERRGDGREDVAAVEGRTRIAPEVLRRSGVENLMRRLAVVDVSKQSVVWSNKQLLVRAHDDRPSRRSNSRIDNRDVNRSGWKGLVSAEENESSG